MSRRQEVEEVIAESYRSSYLPPLEDFARTLADDVDFLRAEKAESARRTQQFELTAKGCVRALESEKAERDAVITKLLEQFGEIVCDPSCGITWTCTRCQAHNRALEIAGRKE